ncbi:hypothetical protein FNV62_07655 [Streptomyces sp. RLB3-17]|uniref:transposase n=1 Tax=unclassified Streptomyces TaxID=2593676 RepID=UPI001161D849|nr:MULTISPECIES: transposase [unclassified Streptomyces]NMI56036.1 hypothetical protein [Streptomyces sp. RLA2-12]QDN55488.1 hypothetical protein FNV67_09415 [Streptomyces sp. S1D4-20]QDN65666.1 hypothetical protein FNV66_09010 [Streptomyces sp. S1D4-14]QDN96309.1 hypothetical protein FNV58_10160 [Streptomyces sp. RLB1-9]QDO18018.1 hypothetical protein FNV65_08610 [Streptomyces sp. S1A1-8]
MLLDLDGLAVTKVELLANGTRRVHLMTTDVTARARPGCGVFAFPRFLALLHPRLEGPFTVVWDNYFSHISKHVKQYAQQQDWLTIIQLPSYAPELNPVELLWAHTKEKIADRAFRSIVELHRAARSALCGRSRISPGASSRNSPGPGVEPGYCYPRAASPSMLS